MTHYGYPLINEQDCEGCRYSRSTDMEWMTCQRHPPVITDLTSSVAPSSFGWFPTVATHGWCGEWAPQEVSE